jgi:hypothetical protein
MSESSLKKSGNFVIYINEYASSRPSIISKASLPGSIAELTSNKKILIPQIYQQTIPAKMQLIPKSYNL